MMTIETDQHIAEAIAALQAADPRLAPLVEAAGMPPLRRREDGFAGLVAIVVSQQLSRASADAIHGRLCALLDPLTPDAVAAAREEALAAAGLSRPKIRTLRALGEAFASGEVDTAALRTQSDEAVCEALCRIKGIGPWTADVYLLACLGRADVFPARDLALQEAARAGLGLPARPDHVALTGEAEAWRPWRSVAARLLWSYYRHIRNEAGAPAGEQGGMAA